MKKTKHILISLFIVGWFAHNVGAGVIQADWWERPSVQPTQPSIERNLPASTPVPEPTQQPVQQPTQNPTAPPSQPTATVISPTQTPSGGAGQGGPLASSDDPCAPGKSYSGQYCGWSQGVGGESGDGNSSTGQPQTLAKAGGPAVKGLSKTSSSDVTPSGIILLTGILCLLLYARSKIEFRRAL